MKKILRHYIVETVTLYICSQLVTGLVFEKGNQSILLAGLALMIASLIVRPLINILILPINLLTFNLFKWVSSAVTLYLVTLIVPGFKIAKFFYPGLVTKWFDIPQVSLEGVLAIIAFSLLITSISSVFYWLIKS